MHWGYGCCTTPRKCLYDFCSCLFVGTVTGRNFVCCLLYNVVAIARTVVGALAKLLRRWHRTLELGVAATVTDRNLLSSSFLLFPLIITPEQITYLFSISLRAKNKIDAKVEAFISNNVLQTNLLLKYVDIGYSRMYNLYPRRKKRFQLVYAMCYARPSKVFSQVKILVGLLITYLCNT